MDPWADGGPAAEQIEIAERNRNWPRWFDTLAELIRGAQSAHPLEIDHIGSTSVRVLPAKPIIDIDLIVTDVTRKTSCLPPLEADGFALKIREPWCKHQCRMFDNSRANVYVFSPDCAETARHGIFRD